MTEINFDGKTLQELEKMLSMINAEINKRNKERENELWAAVGKAMQTFEEETGRRIYTLDSEGEPIYWSRNDLADPGFLHMD